MSFGHRDTENTEINPTLGDLRPDIEGPDPRVNAITHKIIAAAIEVHRHLGPGYLEAYYESALAIEFARVGLKFSRQHAFSVKYKGELIGTGKLDFLVEDEIIVELKAVETLAPVHTAQVISYLKAVNRRLCLIINFNVKVLKDGLKRVVR